MYLYNSMDQNSTLPWVEKYRPVKLNGIISQNKIIQTLKLYIKNKTVPHMLFYGKSGTGKTTAAMACANELYGNTIDYMVMELNASDERGIEVVRNEIKKFVSTSNLMLGNSKNKNLFKLVILDETDAMTSDAQDILRKVVEEYTKNARFCLICNHLQKIKPALQSRCTLFRFSPLEKPVIKKKLIQIAKKEKLKLTQTGIDTIMKQCKGDVRKVINMLQQVSMTYDIVNGKNVNNCIGYPQDSTVVTILNLLLSDPFKITYNNINKILKEKDISLQDVVYEICSIIVNYILTKDTCKTDINKLSVKQLQNLLIKLKGIENIQSMNSRDIVQTGAVVGIFNITRLKN